MIEGCHEAIVTPEEWEQVQAIIDRKPPILSLIHISEVDESWYEDFYHHLRMEMDEYRRLKRSLRVLKSYTDYEEDI